MLFDCISRKGYLGQDFDNEIEIFHQKDNNIIGALTIGEISSSDYPEFYTKTIVFCVLMKKDIIKMLNRKELEIGFFLVMGCTDNEIAEHLDRSYYGIKSCLRNMLHKLEFSNRVELVYHLGLTFFFECTWDEFQIKLEELEKLRN